MARKETENAYNKIIQSGMFRLSGPEINLPEAIIALCEEIEKEDSESDWHYLGEGYEACAGDMLVGFYWALTEWHGGQSSIEYQALSAIGKIFNPGCTSGLEADSGEKTAYDMADEWFEKKHPSKA